MFSNDDVSKVYHRIKKSLVNTPCLYSSFLSNLLEAEVYLKLENTHATGSFKERGALNFLLKHSVRGADHVVAASAGNHAQAVALHARNLGLKASIFMPKATPNVKIAETARLSAHVTLVGQSYDASYKAARKFAKLNDALYLHAYNDLDVIQGQATVGLEILQQVGVPDVVIVPVGGGGLISGVAQYFKNASKANPKIIGVEPSELDSMAVALNKGRPVVMKNIRTIAEGIAVLKVGEITHKMCQALEIEWQNVSDSEIQSAITRLLERQKIVTEGAGAASVAALLTPQNITRFKGKKVVAIISGGNIDISLLAKLSAKELVISSRLCRMSITIKDSPGSLSSLLNSISASSGNIIDVHHERHFADLRWNEVLVHLTVETKEEAHENLMIGKLKNEGYMIRGHKVEMGRE